MAEELKQEIVAPDGKPAEQVEEREYSEIEIRAIDQGWVPKEDFDGDQTEFIEAPEFVRRGELFGKIERQSKELKAVRQALDAFRVHHSKVKDMEYKRALGSLKDARRQATLDGDHERALVLEDKIDEVQVERDNMVNEVAQTAVQEPDEYTPQFTQWVERNPWYETNRVMRKTADVLGKEFHEEGNAPSEVLLLVEKAMRKEFPDKFTSGASRRTTSVESSTRSNTVRDTFTMSAEEEDIMRKIVAVTPGYTEADYKKELKALKGR